MDIDCSWCEQRYTLTDQKAQKKMRKHGFVRTRCPNCSSLNVISNDAADRITKTVKENKSSGGALRMRWHNSIQFQLTTTLLLVITCIIGTFLFYNYTSAKKKIGNELYQFSSNTAEQLAKYLAAPLWGVETAQIADALASEMLDKQIYAIHIIDNDQKGVLVGRKRDKRWNIEPSDHEVHGDYISAERDIIYKNETIGRVKLFVTPRFMREELNRSSLNLIVTTIVLYATIIAAVFFTLHKVVVHPITALTSAANRMSRGDLDTHIDIQSNNEIGSLVEAIRRMQTSLVLSFKRLQQRS